MPRRPPRGLSAEERALWQKVTESATPMHPEHGRKVTEPPAKEKAPQRARPPLTKFQIGQRAASPAAQHDLAPSVGENLQRQPLNMDRKSFGRMKRGKLEPEARIDLHGMTLARAHPALTAFVLQAHGSGKRLVLVITGKGKGASDDGPIPVRRGVLKHQVPQWLAAPPLGPVVLQVAQAHPRHGGAGAYYVYLRRAR